MTQVSQPTAADNTAHEYYEEPEARELRERLNLRPTTFVGEGPHPDRRPCPPWCFVSTNEGAYHEVYWRDPMTACHSFDDAPTVTASLYPGDTCGGRVSAATIESHLSQVGQGDPRIKVYLRQGHGKDRTFGERLRLTIEDARELIVALQYLVDTAEGGAQAD